MNERLSAMSPGMIHAGIVEGSVAHLIASTWKYGNSYVNSIEIATALGLDPAAPLSEVQELRTRIAALEAAINAYVATCESDDWTPEGERQALDALKEARHG